jgi:hypothetical protein
VTQPTKDLEAEETNDVNATDYESLALILSILALKGGKLSRDRIYARVLKYI